MMIAQPERGRRERVLLWMLGAPAVVAVLVVCAAEVWQLVAALGVTP